MHERRLDCHVMVLRVVMNATGNIVASKNDAVGVCLRSLEFTTMFQQCLYRTHQCAVAVTLGYFSGLIMAVVRHLLDYHERD